MNRYVALCVMLMLLASCGTTGPAPEDAFFRLPELRSPATNPLGGKSIRISPFDAGSLYRDRAIVYGDENRLELRRHHYHFWADAPPVLVRAAIAGALTRSDPAASIHSATAGGDYELQGRIDAFERYPDGNRSTVEVTLTLTLRQRGDVVLTGEYREVGAAGSEHMVDSVTAFGAALQRIVDRFTADLARAALAP